MEIRLAEIKDINQLIKMRWDFTLEDDLTGKIQDTSYNQFFDECHTFLLNVISGNNWFIWLAENNGKIVSHIYIELVQKVPRPGRVTRPFAFMTNVYTIEEYRGKGIGSKLLMTVNKWIDEMNYKFVIVWPSESGINFYKKNGYNECKEPMEYFSK